jgi:hypothetical protein
VYSPVFVAPVTMVSSVVQSAGQPESRTRVTVGPIPVASHWISNGTPIVGKLRVLGARTGLFANWV